LTELHDTAGTIWADAADGEGTSGLLDAHVGAGLMSMFQKKAKQATEKKVKVEKSKKGQVTVLIDSKRALKGGILLAAFKDYDLVKRSLFVGDSDFLTLQRVEALMEIVPSENELAKIDSYSLEEGERLAECERYFMSVRSVPRIERRLAILRMKHTFGAALANVRRMITEYHDACNQVLNSDHFRRVLEVALELGNTFNGQRAYGTRLSSLLEFLTMKASGDSRITLLHYLCSVLKSKMPELYDFYKQLPQAKLPKQNQIEIELRDITAQIMLANHELAHQQEAGHSDEIVDQELGVADTFYQNMTSFCQDAAEDADRLEDEFNAMAETTQMTSAYLGEHNSTMDKVFEMLSAFLTSYMKAQGEHGRLIKSDVVGPVVAPAAE